MPRTGRADRTLALLTEGYEFITRRCEALDSDVFETTLQFEPTICMRGTDAAELFYDEERFARQGAAPSRLQKTLFGVGGVQGLDDQAHRTRKEMFLSLMSSDRLDTLREDFVARWHGRLPAWERADEVVLHDEAGSLLTEVIYAWAGLPLGPDELPKHLAAHRGMIVGAPGVAPVYLWGRAGRRWAERWVVDHIDRARSGELTPSPGAALEVIADHVDADGERLPARLAAVELINVLRPTIANDRYIVFAAKALHEHPDWQRSLAEDGDREQLRAFVQEVRRTAPFFPFVAARVRKEFVWRGMTFPEGRRVLLDLFGTNLDRRVWPEPTRFRPERHLAGEPSPFACIPQGGGDHHQGHRCAGEWITIELMAAAVGCLTRSMTYEVPRQDLSVGRARIPGLPRSRFVMRDVRRAAPRGPLTDRDARSNT